jgi:hypothetical protein
MKATDVTTNGTRSFGERSAPNPSSTGTSSMVSFAHAPMNVMSVAQPNRSSRMKYTAANQHTSIA